MARRRGPGRTKARRARKPSGERRAEIVDATLAILVEEGLHAWTTAEVARRVGVSEATIFRHFRTKEEILNTAMQQVARGLRERVEAYRGDGSAWDRAEGLVRHVLRFMAETKGAPLGILTGQAIRVSPELRREVIATRAAVHGRLSSLFAEALAEADEARTDAATLADLAIAVGQSTGLRWLMEGRRLPLEETASAMLAALRSCVGGVRSGAPGRKR